MIADQIAARGVTDPATLSAMERVPRHKFVPPDLAEEAYGDFPLPIGGGQTMSQPYIVAVMTEYARLTPEARVLEIGTGSGYAAAVLGEIAEEVYTIERVPQLAEQARGKLEELGYDNVEVRLGDGTLGWPEHAPYDAILVTAGAPVVPEALTEQLAEGGRMVIPVGDSFGQQLLVVTRAPNGQLMQEAKELVRFVPLIGEQGW